MGQGDADVIELQGIDHKHLNDFQHLELSLESLQHDYDLGWKFDPHEQYPPAQGADPYLKFYVSFGKRNGPRQTLSYALTRSYWKRVYEISDEDRRLLWDLAMAQVPQDLWAIERGDEPQALGRNEPMYLSP